VDAWVAGEVAERAAGDADAVTLTGEHRA
jgi:hypothetical protein